MSTRPLRSAVRQFQPESELDAIFRPHAIAVIGASTEPNALGRRPEDCKAADARMRLRADR